ncbi:hypothetical protein YSY22_09710 [Brevibacillus formosus]
MTGRIGLHFRKASFVLPTDLTFAEFRWTVFRRFTLFLDPGPRRIAITLEAETPGKEGSAAVTITALNPG